MPTKKNNGYRRGYWPPSANKARGDAIDQSGAIRADIRRITKEANTGLSNFDKRNYHLMAGQLKEILRICDLVDRTAEMIQIILENAQAKPDNDDLAEQVAEIMERLERLENSRPNLAIVQQRKAQ